MAMKVVTILDLKNNLSALIQEAAAGEKIVVTRHGRPVACLTGAGAEHLHVGRRAGKAALRPLLRNATRGRYLAVLADDRHGGGRDR